MIFDQNGAVTAFQTFLSKATSYGQEPKVTSVKMTQSGRFIVDIAQPEAVSCKTNPEQRTSNSQVDGSNPSVHTISNKSRHTEEKDG